ncbi:MAG: NAD(P)/FAD-dependent oxidoreductase [Bacteroidota bacterium]
MSAMVDVIVVGGGLAGLISAIQIRKAGYEVSLIEKKEYPFHRVCGEYISNEVRPFLERNGLFPSDANPANISTFWLTSTNGKKATLPLKMGAFGISRYAFDLWLYEKACSLGVNFLTGDAVADIHFEEDCFTLTLTKGLSLKSRYVIGAFGKRSMLDKQLKRPFMTRKSPYVGVKYHLSTDFPEDVIALHNFQNGYCGISKVEGETYNLCYLSHRNNLRKYGGTAAMEEAVMWKNPHLRSIFQNADFHFSKPEVINEISFERKEPVIQHILMAGDSAGLITPLCGNGMAMAIHGAKLVSETMIKHKLQDRIAIEKEYTAAWEKHFRNRLWAGRQIQRFFGSDSLSNIAVNLARYAKPIAGKLVEQTHGKVF